jgi:cob(I)alamin adenosyltransferase
VGFLHVITGDGKGKTTSAVGLAVRARSRGLRVLFARFMKTGEDGETALLARLEIDVITYERVLSPLFNPEADPGAIREAALDALSDLRGRLSDYGLVVLDEFVCLIDARVITIREALAFVAGRPGGTELVLTGRGAPEELIARADYAMDIRDLKHPARTGTPARPGIEY